MRRGLALVVIAAVLAACGDGAQEAAPGAEPAASPLEAEVRVLFMGDSVMANVAPALLAALNADDRIASRYVAQATISRESGLEGLWRRQLDEFDPHLIVGLIASWEVLSPAFGEDEAWRGPFRADVLDPFVDLITSDGARLLWIGMPASRDEQMTVAFASLNRLYLAQADAREEVDFLNAGQVLNGPTGGFAEFLPDEQGTLVRTRRAEGNRNHLCPPGVVRLAEPILAWIQDHADVEPATDWRDASWTRPPELRDPEECDVE